jgi:hypothetical protein
MHVLEDLEWCSQGNLQKEEVVKEVFEPVDYTITPSVSK